MLNDTFINNLWYRAAGLEEDWSWLNGSRKPSDDWQPLLELFDLKKLGLSDLDIERLRNRLIMGDMRYGRLKDRGKEYFSRRFSEAEDCISDNRECYYDYVNFVLIACYFGHITQSIALKKIIFWTVYVNLWQPPFNPKDRV